MMTLSEELLLLGIHDEKGSVILSASASLPYGIAASILLDLHYMGKINFVGQAVLISDDSPTGVEFLDFALDSIKEKAKVKDIKFWIRALGNSVIELRTMILESLVIKGILRREAQKLIWLIKFHRYPTLDPVPELQTRDKIHKTVLWGLQADERLIALISLMYSCNLINEVFPKNFRDAAKESILALVENEEFGQIVREIVAEMSISVSSSTSGSASM